MTTKIQMLYRLHEQLTNYLNKTGLSNTMPSLAETILFLNTQVELGYNADQLENQYRDQIPQYQQASDANRAKVKEYLNAMIDLLKE